MAKGQALRNLQTRLAQRLQEAQTQGSNTSWLAVEVGQARYLLPLELAGEIFPPVNTQKVPYTAPWFMGVANLRGLLCGDRLLQLLHLGFQRLLFRVFLRRLVKVAQRGVDVVIGGCG